MATFNKFDKFVLNVSQKVFNLGSDTLKVALSNVAPTGSSNNQLSDITQITAANGYTSGGTATTISSSTQTSGTYKLVVADVVFTASGGSIASFRYAVFYDATATNSELIGYHDYGSAIAPATGETFTWDADPSTGILTLA